MKIVFKTMKQGQNKLWIDGKRYMNIGDAFVQNVVIYIRIIIIS